MTRKELVREIIHILDEYDYYLDEMEKEALNMAIEALQQQTCDRCKYSEETDGMTCYECVKGISDNFEALEQEPKCEDCKWNTWDNNCMVEYRGCRFEPKNGE